MPGDSVIKQLNLRLGLGRSRSGFERAATVVMRPALVRERVRLAAVAKPTSHRQGNGYMRGVKLNLPSHYGQHQRAVHPGLCVCVCGHVAGRKGER